MLQIHHPGSGWRDDRLRDHEGVPEPTVEPDGDVAGQLNVLALVLADGNLVGVVEEDVGRLEGRVGE